MSGLVHAKMWSVGHVWLQGLQNVCLILTLDVFSVHWLICAIPLWELYSWTPNSVYRWSTWKGHSQKGEVILKALQCVQTHISREEKYSGVIGSTHSHHSDSEWIFPKHWKVPGRAGIWECQNPGELGRNENITKEVNLEEQKGWRHQNLTFLAYLYLKRAHPRSLRLILALVNYETTICKRIR